MLQRFLLTLFIIALYPCVSAHSAHTIRIDGTDLFYYLQDGKEGVSDSSGKMLIPCIYSSVRFRSEDNLFYVKIESPNRKLEGAINRSGKLIVPCEYASVYYKSEERIYYVKKNTINGELEGVLDSQGKLIVPCEYSSVSYYSEDRLYFVKKRTANGELEGVLNNQGKMIIPCEYTSVYYDSEDILYKVSKRNHEGELEGILDVQGKLIVPCEYSSVSYYAEDGLYYVKKKSAYGELEGVLNNQGKMIVPCEYASIYFREDDKQFCVKKKVDGEEQEGILDFQGKLIVPCEYTSVYYYSEDKVFRATKTRNGQELKGLISETGNIIVPCDYRSLCLAAHDIYLVQDVNGKYGYYAQGKEIIPCIYDNAKVFVNDHAKVTKDGVVSLIANPLKDSSFMVELAQSKSKKGGGPVQSRYPAPNSDVDTNIPRSATKHDNKFAIIIANENYEVSPVPYALNDGRKFKQYCTEALGIPESNAFIYEDATYGNLISAVDKIKNLSDAYDGDADFILYYAGHGVPDEASKSAYLLPVDGSVSDIKHTAYSLKKLYSELSTLKANRIVFFIDACFSGAKREDEMLLAGRGVAIKVNDEIPQNKMVVFSASTGSETAHQLTEKTHGLFTYYLLKAIQADGGNVTLGSLSESVTKNVKRQSVVINSKKQTPTVIPSAALGDEWTQIKL